MTIETLIWLFPIMFMIHELEEIIFMKPWIKKNAATIQKRFPFIGRRFRKATKDFSTRKFALIVAEEFIIISAVTVVSMQWGFINMFTGMLIAYSLHLFIHIVQFIIYRRYIPTIVTSLISIPYLVFAFMGIAASPAVSVVWSLTFAGIFAVVLAVNLFACHYIVAWIKI